MSKCADYLKISLERNDELRSELQSTNSKIKSTKSEIQLINSEISELKKLLKDNNII